MSWLCWRSGLSTSWMRQPASATGGRISSGFTGGAAASDRPRIALASDADSASGCTSPDKAKTRLCPTKWRLKCAAVSAGVAASSAGLMPSGGWPYGWSPNRLRMKNRAHSSRSSFRCSSICPSTSWRVRVNSAGAKVGRIKMSPTSAR